MLCCTFLVGLWLLCGVALASDLKGLDAPGANREYAEKMMLYGRLVGDWHVEYAAWDANGKQVAKTTGEWHWGWVLDGRAIQDVWIMPGRAERQKPGAPKGEWGTTLRYYDPKVDAWHIVFVGPAYGNLNVFVAHARGDEIVQEGTGTSGKPARWIFSEITPNSFRWRDEVSDDGGKTWKLREEMHARRQANPIVIVAHPDDETSGVSILLQRTSDSLVVYCTDGAPEDPWFWSEFRSRAEYARIRRDEAVTVLATAGPCAALFLSDFDQDLFHDQRLYQALPLAAMILLHLVQSLQPDAIVAPAYEGGHPDHDCCSFLASIVGSLGSVPVLEFPLYHRNVRGELVTNVFARKRGAEVALSPTASELARRRAMLATYESQRDLDSFVTSETEWLRVQERYDYTQRPSEVVNYECWHWPMSAAMLCEKFASTKEGFTTMSQMTANCGSHRRISKASSDTELSCNNKYEENNVATH